MENQYLIKELPAIKEAFNLDILGEVLGEMEKEIVEKEVEKEVEKDKKKRASVEYNGMELVVAVLFIYVYISTYDELLEKLKILEDDANCVKISFNTETDLKNYVNDITKKKKIVTNFIINFRESIKKYEDFKPDNIKYILISGKKNKHSEINEINKDLDKKVAKSDIYIKFMNDKICGISIKETKFATKSNYSVHKMLGPETDKMLTTEKKTYLKEKGYASFDRNKREEVNQLFYPQNKENPYWTKMKEEISKNKLNLTKQLVTPLFCSKVPYDVYEFDGTSFIKLNKNNDDFSQITFEEHLPYYLDKKGEERKAAKLFYRLVIEKKIYRVEIRWKGNVHNASPQFLIHEE
jgi:hypothetical protein